MNAITQTHAVNNNQLGMLLEDETNVNVLQKESDTDIVVAKNGEIEERIATLMSHIECESITTKERNELDRLLVHKAQWGVDFAAQVLHIQSDESIASFIALRDQMAKETGPVTVLHLKLTELILAHMHLWERYTAEAQLWQDFANTVADRSRHSTNENLLEAVRYLKGVEERVLRMQDKLISSLARLVRLQNACRRTQSKIDVHIKASNVNVADKQINMQSDAEQPQLMSA